MYSSTPLFSALLGFFLLHEVLGPAGWAGGAFLVAAAALASYDGREEAKTGGASPEAKIDELDQVDDQR